MPVSKLASSSTGSQKPPTVEAASLSPTSVDPADQFVILINTITVDPDRAEELLTDLSQATETMMRHRQGFVSANLHVSRDRQHVANYAQWRTHEDLDAMMSDPASRLHMSNAASIATAFDPILYGLRESYSAT